MSHLVPVKRLDKNQRLVTRYVLPEGEVSPSPLAKVQPSLSQKTDPTLMRLAALIHDEDNEIRMSYLSLESLGELKQIAEHLSEESDASVLWKVMNPMRANHRGTVVENDISGLLKHHRMSDDVPLSYTLQAVRGLHAYDKDLDEKTVQALVDTVAVVTPVLEEVDGAFDFPPDGPDEEFAHGLDNYYSFFGGDVDEQFDHSLWIRNKEFVELIKDHSDRADEIFSFIKERRTIRPQMIRTFLETDTHPALLEGAL